MTKRPAASLDGLMATPLLAAQQADAQLQYAKGHFANSRTYRWWAHFAFTCIDIRQPSSAKDRGLARGERDIAKRCRVYR
jgi:hypothetical protein